MVHVSKIIFAMIGLPTVFACAAVRSFEPVTRAPASANTAVSSEQFLDQIGARVKRVEEFRALAEVAKEMGLRMWIAGGSATGLARFIQRDLERENELRINGRSEYVDGKFAEYNFYDIFRSTQDADIVIDGTEAQAEHLEKILKQRFGYLGGEKSIWEVRLLRASRGSGVGEKDSLFGFDFQNQNTDSLSTGLIEISDPPAGEIRVRDIFDWKNQVEPEFLKSILGGKLKYIRNPNHFLTKRAKSGINPEILSALRAYTKAFQFGAEIPSKAESVLRQVCEAFDPLAPIEGSNSEYVVFKIAKEAEKIYLHAENVARARKVLDANGLREKLIVFAKRYRQESLVTLLEKKPLPSHQLGARNLGRTAGELKVATVSHVTNSYEAYESITRSPTGRANVFSSRPNVGSEMAANGEGFYVTPGKAGGARTGGMTIRFDLDPNAIEGVDFVYHPEDDEIRILNARALRVIHEKYTMEPLEYFRLLDEGFFTGADLAQMRLIQLRLSGRLNSLGKDEMRAILEIVRNHVRKSTMEGATALSPLMIGWLETRLSEVDPGIISEIAKIDAGAVLSYASVRKHPNFENFVERALSSGSVRQSRFVAENVLLEASYYNHPRYDAWVESVLRSKGTSAIYRVLSQPELFHRENYSRWVHRAIDVSPLNAIYGLLVNPAIFFHPHYAQWVDRVIEVEVEFVILGILRQPEIMNQGMAFERWMKRAIQLSPASVRSQLLELPQYRSHPAYGSWQEALAPSPPMNSVSTAFSVPKKSKSFIEHCRALLRRR